jgi:hypothetical protein
MRRTLSIVALTVGVLLGSLSPARGALLTLAGSDLTFFFPWIDASCDPLLGCSVLSNELVFPQRLASVPVFVASAGGDFVLPAGTFTGTEAIPTAIFTGVALIDRATIGNLSNAAGVFGAGGGPVDPGGPFAGAGGGFGGFGGLDGTLFVNVLGLFNLEVPLGPVGAGGTAVAPPVGSLMITVFGTGWTTGSVAVTGITSENDAPPGGFVNTVTFAGYDNRTPAHRGTLLLVSPFKVVTNATGNLAALASQTLHFEGEVPAPGALVLLGAGALGLAGHGYARRRWRRRG